MKINNTSSLICMFERSLQSTDKLSLTEEILVWNKLFPSEQELIIKACERILEVSESQKK